MNVFEQLEQFASSGPSQNKKTVLAFYDLAFNQHKPEEAVALYMGKTYIQHNPQAPNGPEAFIAYAKAFKGQVHFKRTIAEGNLVAVHSESNGEAVVDIFRLENGKIVEHWDVIQKIPTKSANDNTMFGLTLQEFARGNPDALRRWYEDGADGLINWGTEGDLTRCHEKAQEYMDSEQAWGFCERRAEAVYGESNRSHDIKAGQYPKK